MMSQHEINDTQSLFNLYSVHLATARREYDSLADDDLRRKELWDDMEDMLDCYTGVCRRHAKLISQQKSSNNMLRGILTGIGCLVVGVVVIESDALLAISAGFITGILLKTTLDEKTQLELDND